MLSRDSQDDTILIEIQYRMEILGADRLVTYVLEIGGKDGAPLVRREILRYKRGAHGAPFHFLDFTEGRGFAITNEEDFNKPDEELEREDQNLNSPDILAIKGLGQFERFKAANAFRRLIEAWHVSDFHIDSARGRKEASGASEHLSESGDNLPRVALYLYEQHRPIFDGILQKMAQRVPGCDLEEVLWLVKKNGYTEVRRAKDDPQITAYMSQGDHLGYLWKEGFFEGADPQ